MYMEKNTTYNKIRKVSLKNFLELRKRCLGTYSNVCHKCIVLNKCVAD